MLPKRLRGVGGTDTDDADFTAFVHATAPRLFRSALLLAGDRQLAEDLLQTTYARLFVSWRKVRRAGNPVGYARTTLTRVFLSHRRLRSSSEVPVDTVADRKEIEHVTPDLRLDLVAALRLLPPGDRVILVLRYCEDRSVAETAAQLHLTETAVRTRARRALARLRPHLTAFQETTS
jgi:RNA polymerase sigma-70 factor (sigma-E family)